MRGIKTRWVDRNKFIAFTVLQSFALSRCYSSIHLLEGELRLLSGKSGILLSVSCCALSVILNMSCSSSLDIPLDSLWVKSAAVVDESEVTPVRVLPLPESADGSVPEEQIENLRS